MMIVYAWRNAQTRGSRAFAAACLVSIPWMIGEVMCQLPQAYKWLYFAESLRYLGAAPLPVALYVFTRQYFGRDVSNGAVAALLIVPVISYLAMVTDPWHGLFFSSVELTPTRLNVKYGLYFWLVHIPYSYGMMMLSLFTVITELSRASRHYRPQILLLLVSLSIPAVVNVLGVLQVVGKITPYSFPVFFSLMAYAIFRLKFLGGNPIAYETVFQTIRDGVLVLDREDIVRDANPSAAKELGKAQEAIIGKPVREALDSCDAALRLYETDPKGRGEIAVENGGSTRYLLIDSTDLQAVAGGTIEGRIVMIRDITDRHEHQLSLEAMAFHDPLTRLANRRKFQEEVDRAIERSDEKGEPFAIMYFDLNKFKAVNDTYGHEVGDELLKYVAARVASILRKPDLLGRLGGDEFALLLHNCDESGVELVTKRILDNVQRPFTVGEITLVADLSIGAAYYPKDGNSLTELLRNADAAMYRAKVDSREGGYYKSPVVEVDQVLEM